MTDAAVHGPELAHLGAFLSVCSEGSFTGAARRQGCSQPAISYQIRKLEEAIGVRLLERSGRRVIVTPEGQRVRAFGEGVFADLERVRAECAAGHRLEPLRLGSASGFGRYVLVPALHACREAGGERQEVRLQYEAADVLLERLEAGEYEAAFVYKQKVSSFLAYETVYREELVLVASRDGAAEARERGLEGLGGLEAAPFVTYEECDYVFGRWFEWSFGGQPSRIRSRAHFTELEEVLEYVSAGVGLSVVPRDAAEGFPSRNPIEILYAAGSKPCYNDVYLVTRAGAAVRAGLRSVADLIRSRSPA